MLDTTFSDIANVQLSLGFHEPVDVYGLGTLIHLPIPTWKALVVIARPRLEEIARETAADHGIAYSELVGSNRARRFTRARQDFMWRARMVIRADGKHRYSTTQIARFFDGKGGRIKPMDHTTVIHACRRVEERRRAARLDRVRQEIAAEVLIHRVA